LDAVLEDIEPSGVDRIVYLGDICLDGPAPVEVLEKRQSRPLVRDPRCALMQIRSSCYRTR